MTPEQVRANRLKLLLLWMIPLGLMAIAGIVYALVQAGYMAVGSKNNGDLIQPAVQLSDLTITTPVDASYSSEQLLNSKWSIVVRGSEQCDEACKEALYLSRQIHVRLDKAANRVQRVYLSDAPVAADAQAYFASEHRYLKIAVADKQALIEIDGHLTAIGEDKKPASFFLIDPQGWAMMAYHSEHDGGLILSDLKYLLKYSRER